MSLNRTVGVTKSTGRGLRTVQAWRALPPSTFRKVMNELSAGLSRLFHARRRADLVHIENPGLEGP